MAPPREYDLLVWGATGFTGSLMCKHLAQHAPADLRWAVAGRRADALQVPTPTPTLTHAHTHARTRPYTHAHAQMHARSAPWMSDPDLSPDPGPDPTHCCP